MDTMQQEHPKTQRARDIGAPIQHITLDGQRYMLTFSNKAARVAEDVYEQIYGLDVGYADILKSLAQFKYKAVMAVFYGALIAGGADMDWQTFDELFKLDSIDGIRELIVKGVVDALPKEGSGEDTANP